MTEDNVELEARLAEQDSFEPPEAFVDQANVSDPGIYDEFEENWPDCWERAAEMLDWEESYDTVLDDSNPPFYKWFTGGSLNASAQCLDRHLAERGDETAIEWVGEPVDEADRSYTYEALHREVNEAAAALREMGVGEDDVVTLYMPMIPELPIAMLACARIGAPHSVVFAGFSADALATRMNAADSEYLVTCDGYYRRGDPLDHLSKANTGLNGVEHDTETLVVNRLPDADDQGVELRDDQTYWTEALLEQESAEVEPVSRNAEDMLFLMYTSGTTGKPKGVKHTTGGYLSWATWTSHAVLDVKPEDTYFCAADIGWITGHSYIVYGPLSLGTTTMMYEGTPDYPERNRLWEIIEEYEADQLYTAPTAIRAFMKWGKQYPDQHDLSSLRLLGTVGEPINPRAWKWYYTHIGDESCPIIDTWWQTETGAISLATLPGITPMKPGKVGPPLPGIDARVVDEDGDPVEPGEPGYLTIAAPWPGMLRGLREGDERYRREYWLEGDDGWRYRTGDGATVDEDGYVTILGRVDDVINVRTHRFNTAELESAIVGADGVTEAAVVGDDDGKIVAYVTTRGDIDPDESLRETIGERLAQAVGDVARPDRIVFTPDLPKTRSGKIMRRLLEDIARGDEFGDVSALRNPEVVGEIESAVREE